MSIRIVVCAKEVLDPDAVNNYALEGKLVIGEDGKTLTQTTIPRLMNAYDEQAIEAALKLRDAGVPCTITVVSVGADCGEILKHAAALGADEIAAIALDGATTDHHGIAAALAGYIKSRGGADLVLCGRQASDDDQGVVPALIGERLAAPVVTVARSVEVTDTAKPTVRVIRVTPDGDETVLVDAPVVVTISNELGAPRYPTMAGRMAARKKKATSTSPADLGLEPQDLQPRVTLARQFVPTVKGECEFIAAGTPAEAAADLIQRLRAQGALR